ncbi:hypothetical protein POM88_051052 [Heracleum sosnowskyi]|uniref:Uncharacterized protein n=1 Tax=Heracleum sosnowskyi TaxID=360622 RepID=A0AAD8M223_9APIA|nr:hypothetical protein POM88_051052 [Heracleum sosnowskyi]
MDSNQRQHGLHKARADMMLDTSKEADANKVMAAETKAQRLELELQVMKDESVQMMVGQKKMLDDKITESKMTSPNHLELENGSFVAADKENLDQNQRAEYPECLEAIRIRNLYGPVPELPSILLKSKEYKFYRNGCAHRIHSFERNILDRELSLSRQPNDASGKAKVEGGRRLLSIRSTCEATTDEAAAANMLNITSNKDGCISCLHEVQTFDLILKAAKSAINTKYRKKKFTSSKKIPERLFRKLHETPVVTRSDPTPESVQDGTQPSEDPSEDSLQLFKYTFQRKRKRETLRISDENVSANNRTPEKK